MRLRNFCVQMGFALFVSIILAILGSVPLAILYMLAHLIWALFDDRKTVSGEKQKALLASKYRDIPKANTQYDLADKTTTLTDSFIKSALLDTIDCTSYTVSKKTHINVVEKFYSSVMSGNYTLQQHTVTKMTITPGDDSPDDFSLICGNKKFDVQESVYNRCELGDYLIEVTVQGFPISSLVIWLDFKNHDHRIASVKSLNSIRFRFNL